MSDASDADAGGRDADADADTGALADAGSAEPVEPPRRSGRLDSETRQGTPYTESQVIMSTVKVVSPFAFTYGLFVTFHGGGSPGGGFQGGAIMAAVVFMIAFAFGIEATRQWLANTVVVALAVGGTLAFAAIGLIPVALGGAFLQYDLLPLPILDPVKYGMEAVEIVGIAAIVSGVLMGLFFVLARGFNGEDSGPSIGDRDSFTDEDEPDEPDDAESPEPADGVATDGGER
ncbi:multicomponent Na+:H+ antiporter subunit B [Halorubrum aquaticum]|uniref:Multicomponent Na+:H+ antiporter subunit B n=1 Tax=Halorubrum aquaticum TaxID=387340 RepID=A0A1I3BCE0_9EURY|nr:MnhB domain-containing protein [Halorubrum aquaticum]SFH59954.1 multicomponent Na+:H+ antiporter subunit B [Halorubrum aquaticum]